MTPRGAPRDAELLLEAAQRLRHDLGKYVRFSAPSVREPGEDGLRQRLRADLLATHSGPAGAVGAVELFDVWRLQDGRLFPASGPLHEHLGRIAAAVETLRGLTPQLESLPRAGLEELDRATLTIARETRELERAAAAEAERGPR